MTASLSPAEVLALPAVVDVPTAGRAFGISRTLAYELARRGEFPVPVLRLGSTLRVTRAHIREALGIPENSEAGPATGPAAATADPHEEQAREDHDNGTRHLRRVN